MQSLLKGVMPKVSFPRVQFASSAFVERGHTKCWDIEHSVNQLLLASWHCLSTNIQATRTEPERPMVGLAIQWSVPHARRFRAYSSTATVTHATQLPSTARRRRVLRVANGVGDAVLREECPALLHALLGGGGGGGVGRQNMLHQEVVFTSP